MSQGITSSSLADFCFAFYTEKPELIIALCDYREGMWKKFKKKLFARIR